MLDDLKSQFQDGGLREPYQDRQTNVESSVSCSAFRLHTCHPSVLFVVVFIQSNELSSDFSKEPAPAPA